MVAAAVAACHWYATTLAGNTTNSPGRPRDRMRRMWGPERLGADRRVAVPPDHGDDCPEGPHRAGSLRQHWDRPAASLGGSGSNSASGSAVARIDAGVVDIQRDPEPIREINSVGAGGTRAGDPRLPLRQVALKLEQHDQELMVRALPSKNSAEWRWRAAPRRSETADLATLRRSSPCSRTFRTMHLIWPPWPIGTRRAVHQWLKTPCA